VSLLFGSPSFSLVTLEIKEVSPTWASRKYLKSFSGSFLKFSQNECAERQDNKYAALEL